jgi:hypothetical protein
VSDRDGIRKRLARVLASSLAKNFISKDIVTPNLINSLRAEKLITRSSMLMHGSSEFLMIVGIQILIVFFVLAMLATIAWALVRISRQLGEIAGELKEQNGKTQELR